MVMTHSKPLMTQVLNGSMWCCYSESLFGLQTTSEKPEHKLLKDARKIGASDKRVSILHLAQGLGSNTTNIWALNALEKKR